MVVRMGRHRPEREAVAPPPPCDVDAGLATIESTGVSVVNHLSAMLDQMDLRYQQRFESQTAQLIETDRRYQERFVAERAALDSAMLASEKAASAALANVEQAVLKWEAAIERRLTLLNELRTDVASVHQLEAVSLRIGEIKERLDRMETGKRVAGNFWGYMVAAAGVVGVVVAVVSEFVR